MCNVAWDADILLPISLGCIGAAQPPCAADAGSLLLGHPSPVERGMWGEFPLTGYFLHLLFIYFAHVFVTAHKDFGAYLKKHETDV